MSATQSSDVIWCSFLKPNNVLIANQLVDWNLHLQCFGFYWVLIRLCTLSNSHEYIYSNFYDMEESSRKIHNTCIYGEGMNSRKSRWPKPSPSDMYKLYFKGLVSKETTKLLAGFRVAICDLDENLLFQMKGPLHGLNIILLEADFMAMKCVLMEAMSMGINHILICYDHDQSFDLVSFSLAVRLCSHDFCIIDFFWPWMLLLYHSRIHAWAR